MCHFFFLVMLPSVLCAVFLQIETCLYHCCNASNWNWYACVGLCACACQFSVEYVNFNFDVIFTLLSLFIDSVPFHSSNREIGAFHSHSSLLLFFFFIQISGFVPYKTHRGKTAPTLHYYSAPYVIVVSEHCTLECVFCVDCCCFTYIPIPCPIIRPAICFCQIFT